MRGGEAWRRSPAGARRRWDRAWRSGGVSNGVFTSHESLPAALFRLDVCADAYK